MNNELLKETNSSIDENDRKIAREVIEVIKILEEELHKKGFIVAKKEEDEGIYICKKFDSEKMWYFPAVAIFDFFDVDYGIKDTPYE